MINKTRTIGRRTMLRGIAAGTSFAVGLPILEAMLDTHGLAYADGSAIEPVFMTYSWGSGVGNFPGEFDRWTPSGVGEGDAWSLSPELMPLAEHKEYVSVLSNMQIMGPGGHHQMRATVFSGQHRYKESYNQNGAYQGLGSDRASIDQHIANRLQAGSSPTPYHSLVLCMSDVGRHYNSIGRGHSFSWREGFELITPETSPLALYQQMFAGFEPDQPGLTAENEVELVALDAVYESAKRLRGRLGTADQQRIDQHLEGLYETELSIEGLATISCEKPTEPGGSYSPDAASVEPLIEKNQVFSRLIAQAFSCGLTRSIQYMFCGMQADPVISDVGATDGLHLLTHNDLNGTQSSQPEMIDAVATYIIERLADTLDELRAVPIGAGNLLDHACIYVASEMMDGRAHSADRGTPMLVIGGAGGRLRGNVHYKPSDGASDEERNMSRALLTVMDAMGLPDEEIDGGEADSPTSVIDELLT